MASLESPDTIVNTPDLWNAREMAEPVASPAPPEVVPCPFCHGDSFELLFEGTDRLHRVPGRFGVVRCTQCGGMYTNPRPALKDFGMYYPAEYGPHHNKPSTVTNPPSAARRLAAATFHRYMRSYDTVDLPLERGRSLLELGCSTGTYLLTQRARGLNVSGVEFAAEPSRFAREQLGLDVFTGQLEDAHFPSSSFDGAVAWMVLEHVPSPVETLEEIRRILKPGGWFAFSVPNAGSWEFRRFHQDWYSLELPRHCSHFTPSFLTRLLREHHFSVERIYHQRNIDNILGSIGYRMESLGFSGPFVRSCAAFPSNSVGPARFLVRPMLQPLACLLAAVRQAGRLTVLARTV